MGFLSLSFFLIPITGVSVCVHGVGEIISFLYTVGFLGSRFVNNKWSGVFSGESHGQRTLVGYSPWGCKESDMTEAT